MDLRQLTQFVMVAEERSFRRAAERLFMAQPPLSTAIKKLEATLGHQLLTRSRRGVELTPAGEAVYAAARRCLEAAAEIPFAANGAANDAEGRIRVGFPGSMTFGLMPRLVGGYRRRYPRARVELREGSNTDLHAGLLADELDVALIRLPVARPPGLVYEPLEEDVMCVALPEHHRLSAQQTLSVRDLLDETMIGYSQVRASALYIAYLQVFQDCASAPPVTQEAVQVPTVLGLVEADLGIALVPSSVVGDYPGRVVFRDLHDLPATARISIVLAYRAEAHARVMRFVEAAKVFAPRHGARAPAA